MCVLVHVTWGKSIFKFEYRGERLIELSSRKQRQQTGRGRWRCTLPSRGQGNLLLEKVGFSQVFFYLASLFDGLPRNSSYQQ